MNLDGDQAQDLINWLFVHESDIRDGAGDFGELRDIFHALFERSAGEEDKSEKIPW
jgi:hypothetical protein